MELTKFLTQLPQYKDILQHIKPQTRQLITGLSGSARHLFINTIFSDTKKPMLLVTDTIHHMDQIVDDFSNIVPEDQIFEFPVEELLAAEVATSSPQFKAQRVKAMHMLQTGQPVIVVTSISGIRRMLPTPNDFEDNKLDIKTGDSFEHSDLILKFHQMGYAKKNLVAAPGEFSVRGSIIDIYPLNTDYPVRMDFFDTELDSLRFFDAANQTSVETIEQIQVLPATDFILTEDERKNGADRLADQLSKRLKEIKDNDLKKTLSNNIQPIINELNQGLSDSKWLLFANLLFEHETSILDYLPTDGILMFDDYSRLLESNEQLIKDENHWAEGKLENGEILSGQHLGLDFETEFKKHRQPQLMFSLFKKSLNGLKLDHLSDIKIRPVQQFFGQFQLLESSLKQWNQNNQTVVIMVQDEKQISKVNQTLEEFDIHSTQTNWDNILNGQVQIIPERLSNGFELPSIDLVIISETELFNKVKKPKRRRHQTFSNAQRIKSYTDLKPGDYVVHVDHGIGKYMGMSTKEIDGKHQDYLSIVYRDDAKLFIPVTQLNLIQKYVSSEDRHPKVNKLGGSEWAKTKRKVANKIEDIADDLIDLYAKRSAEKGFAFPPDDNYQHQFEDDFPYPETPDQIKSTKEIKQDMEKSHPMDRLLVGDVGYGKTEVALRAAFKAIEADKQVAFLVPTTVLAHQHFDTMKQRFKNYPVEIGVLSRFQTPKQTKETIAKLKDGRIDIVVGTHRLLSNDIHFSNLGLLIVDEEQRFGVKHKNKMKQLKASVDVLTLTATPIPRTLNMSMMGVRDLSVIETPPTNRYPIQTYVMEENAGAIQEGIHRELERDGQVFYLHNRVEDIEKTVRMLKSLVPDAKIAYAHGQMSERQLDNVLYDFTHGSYDVLVTTTIIGTGVDMPNVNTLFVENADHMGLSQLYQLRGRIGRSNRIAYSYFMYKPNKVLTQVSENRLEAIRDFTELGSGFKIAMRDLSLRGAGNLLGKQQHGFINSVGYDLYTQMLSDAVARKQGKDTKEKSNSTVNLNLEAYLPNSYIDDSRQKIEMYKRIRQINNDDQYNEIERSLVDRFGQYPLPVSNLLKISKIKLMADRSLIDSIRRVENKIIVIISKTGTGFYDSKDFLKAIAHTDFKSKIGVQNEQMHIDLIIQPRMKKDDQWLDEIFSLVNNLDEQRNELVKERK